MKFITTCGAVNRDLIYRIPSNSFTRTPIKAGLKSDSYCHSVRLEKTSNVLSISGKTSSSISHMSLSMFFETFLIFLPLRDLLCCSHFYPTFDRLALLCKFEKLKSAPYNIMGGKKQFVGPDFQHRDSLILKLLPILVTVAMY